MTKLIRVPFTLSIVVLTSCFLLNKETSRLYLMAEYEFEDERVEIYLDGDKIYDQILTTDPSLSLADEHIEEIPKGKHRVDVKTGTGQEEEIYINVGKDTDIYLGVRLKDSSLLIHKYLSPPTYE